METDRERELRQGRSSLRSLAGGVLAFGLWSVVKTVAIAVTTPFESMMGKEQMELFSGREAHIALYAIVVILVLLMTSIDLIPRIIIARKARKESLGQDQGKGWVILAFVLFVIWIILIPLEIVSYLELSPSGGKLLEYGISLVVDVTTTVILGELCFAARRVKKLANGED